MLRPTTPRPSIVGVQQFCRHTGKTQLLRFCIFVHVRLLNSSPYRHEKRVAARRSMHVA